MYNLLTEVLNMLKTDNTYYIKKSYECIYKNLFLDNKWGSEKLSDVDEYDSEIKSFKKLLPGSIYMFKYNAKNAVTYKINEFVKFEYKDELPLVLCLKETNTYILGINLNICNFALRTLILNDISKLDIEYFERNAEIMSVNGNFPISKNITTFFMVESNILKYLNLLTTKYGLLNTSFIIRTYSKSNILNIRFIEPWLWKYVPFLTYNNIKDSVLNIILDVTNINRIKIG